MQTKSPRQTLLKRGLTFTALGLALLGFVAAPHGHANAAGAPHFKRGLQLSLQKKWPQAEAEYRKAIALDPNNPTYRSYLADALAAQGKFEKAHQSAQKEKQLVRMGFKPVSPKRTPTRPVKPLPRIAAKPNPPRSSPRTAKTRGSSFPQNLPRGFPQSGTTGRTSTTTRSSNGDPFAGTIIPEIPSGTRPALSRESTGDDDPLENASQLFDDGKWPQAEAEYRRVLRLNPDLDQGWNGLGDACFKQNKWSDAEKYYRVAVRLNPQESYYHAQLASALLKLNRRDEAMKAGQEAVRLGLEDHEVFDELGLKTH